MATHLQLRCETCDEDGPDVRVGGAARLVTNDDPVGDDSAPSDARDWLVSHMFHRIVTVWS